MDKQEEVIATLGKKDYARLCISRLATVQSQIGFKPSQIYEYIPKEFVVNIRHGGDGRVCSPKRQKLECGGYAGRVRDQGP